MSTFVIKWECTTFRNRKKGHANASVVSVSRAILAKCVLIHGRKHAGSYTCIFVYMYTYAYCHILIFASRIASSIRNCQAVFRCYYVAVFRFSLMQRPLRQTCRDRPSSTKRPQLFLSAVIAVGFTCVTTASVCFYCGRASKISFGKYG